MNAPLNIQVEIARRLMDEFNADIGDDEQDRHDIIEGQTDALEMIARLLRKAKEKEGHAEAMKAIIADNRDRKARLDDGAAQLRKVAAWAMGELGLTKLPLPDMTVSVRAGKPKVVTNCEPDDLPLGSPFVRTKITYSFDNAAISQALDSGVTLEFAGYGNAEPVLTVRSR